MTLKEQYKQAYSVIRSLAAREYSSIPPSAFVLTLDPLVWKNAVASFAMSYDSDKLEQPFWERNWQKVRVNWVNFKVNRYTEMIPLDGIPF